MKRICSILCVLLLCGLLSGCGRSASADLSGLTDPRGSIPFQQSNFTGGFLETAFAEYYVSYGENSGTQGSIQVRPKGHSGFIPLCEKPNCAHNDENCSAIAIGCSLGYCNDRLYAVADWKGVASLVSMLPDGTDRRVEMSLPDPTNRDGTNRAAYLYVFHENRLLVLYFPDAAVPLEDQIQNLFVIDLETHQVKEPFVDFLTCAVKVGYALQPAEHMIYADAYFRDPSGKEQGRLIEMDMDTGSVRELITMEHYLDYTVDGSVLRYLEPGVGEMEYDLQSGTVTKRDLPAAGITSCRSDDRFVYAFVDASDPVDYMSRDYTMYILTHDYELLDEIDLGKDVWPLYVSEDHLYFEIHRPGMTEISYCLEKSQIGTGKLELQPVG